MKQPQPTVANEIERYLRTGDTDPYHAAWPGNSFYERSIQAHDDLRSALVREVRRFAEKGRPSSLPEIDTIVLTRRKVEPMVRGLFPRAEQNAVLATLEKSVVFLTRDTIERVLRQETWDSTAWDLANLYLLSVGADPLGDDAPNIVGMSQETTCYVTPEYFTQDDPFADFIVHEVAHIFHNCKRGTVGLRQTRRKEWLLDIEFRKRETFAYSCEAFSRILERAKSPTERRSLAEEYGREVRIPDDRVEPAEVADIVRAAASARNGWKVILARCAPVKSLSRAIA